MTEKKKVLIFSTAYYPYVGGAEVAVKEITDRIADVEFHLLTARFSRVNPTEEKVGNVFVYRVGVGVPLLDKLLLPFLGVIKTFYLNRKNRYVAFWCVMATFASGAAYLHNIFSSKKVPIILNLQEGDSEEHFAKKWFGLINLSWKMALKRTDYLTVLSQFLKDRAERFGYKGKVSIIPNGVDLRIFNLPQKRLNMFFNYVHLVTVSRLTEKNGVEDIIRSMSYLSNSSEIKYKLIIFGDGPLKNKLENLAEDLNLIKKDDEKVVFFGYADHKKIMDFFIKQINVLQIFVRPSLSEGFGNSFIEAMAINLPVIATPVGGITDFLVDKETGLFCNVGDPKSIAEKVMEYVDNPEMTEKITKNARKMVEERYSWDKIAPQMRKVFDL